MAMAGIAAEAPSKDHGRSRQTAQSGGRGGIITNSAEKIRERSLSVSELRRSRARLHPMQMPLSTSPFSSFRQTDEPMKIEGAVRRRESGRLSG